MQKNGLNIVDLAKKIQSEEVRKKDYVLPAEQIIMAPEEMDLGPAGIFEPTEHTHRQVAGYTDIPWKYYARLMGDTELYSHNVNHWLTKRNGSKRMIRTMLPEIPDTQVEAIDMVANTITAPRPRPIARAFLSDRFRRIDNKQIMGGIMPTIKELSDKGQVQILSCQVTPTKLYLMLAFVTREGEVKPGDVIQAGLIITNSEIGLSRFSISPYIHRLWCKNGAVVNIAGKEYGLNQIHMGKKVDHDDNYIAYQEETLRLESEVLQMKMNDVVTSLATGPMWDEILDGMKKAAVSEEIKRPRAAIEVLAKTAGLTETEADMTMANMIKEGDLTRWGAGNSITAVANDVEDYDRGVVLQEQGGKILGMSEKDWSQIAMAE